MKINKKWRGFPGSITGTLPCFYCSVDSWQLKTFLIVVIGSLVACSLFILLAAWARGHFQFPEKLNAKPIDCENANDEKDI